MSLCLTFASCAAVASVIAFIVFLSGLLIDQGNDDSVNAVNIKKLVGECTDVAVTTDSEKATIIQSRHRIPEIPMRNDQILVLQVPTPEPLRIVEPKESVTKQMHAEAEYSGMWLSLFEDLTQYGKISISSEYPVMVEDRYVMNPSPIPRYDNWKLNDSETLYLFGAGREKKIYAVPPHTRVVSRLASAMDMAIALFSLRPKIRP